MKWNPWSPSDASTINSSSSIISWQVTSGSAVTIWAWGLREEFFLYLKSPRARDNARLSDNNLFESYNQNERVGIDRTIHSASTDITTSTHNPCLLTCEYELTNVNWVRHTHNIFTIVCRFMIKTQGLHQTFGPKDAPWITGIGLYISLVITRDRNKYR